MISFSRRVVGLALFSLVFSGQFAPAQDKATTTSPSPLNFSAEYLKDRAGIRRKLRVVALSQEFPSKTRTKRALTASLP
jgi:hypothetical protein